MGMGARPGVRATRRQRGMSLRNRRQAFLGHFAANCNVEAAAAAAGVPVSTLYGWRRTDADFAADWIEALTLGYQLLEARLIAHALAGRDDGSIDGIAGTPVAPVNVDLAFKLMGLQRHGTTKGFPGRPRKTVQRDEAMGIFLKRLEQIERRKAAAAAAAGEGAAAAAGSPGPAAEGERPADARDYAGDAAGDAA